MFRPLTPSHRRTPRRGTVVVITIFALITILMVLGLAFMMYAVKEKAVAQAYKEAASSPGTAAPDPTNTINRFFGALIYDENDDGDSLHNALRGHSIARSMYGGRRDTSSPWAGSTVPWAGVGTFHDTTTGFGDRASQVNHTLVMMGSTPYLIDPEWTGKRTIAASGPVPSFLDPLTQANRSYVGKHAGYTYPDLKNFFLGARDPATGEVLVQSFYRDWLFRHTSQPAGQSGLHPNNPNWGTTGTPDADARLRILRPRPAEHPNFPRLPPNADGSYTGDVQNLPGALGAQKNDSLWMHIGLKPITLADGRIVQPMVAPLILPADGLFDLSMHGNQLAGTLTTPPALWHVSHGGYAPWEINLGYGLSNYGVVPNPILSAAQENERRALMQYRAPIPATRQASFDPFTSGRLMPAYSSVAWNAQPVNFTLPTLGNLRGVPSSGDALFEFPVGTVVPYGNFQNDNAPISSHPAAYNPNEFPTITSTNTNTPIYPFTDTKRLNLRYAFTPDWYTQAFAAKSAPGTLIGDSTTYPYDPAPAANWSATFPKKGTYRLDPAHAVRNLFSPRNNSLDRPAISPNFSRGVADALQIQAGMTKPVSLFTTATPPPYPNPAPRGAITDFAADNQWVNAYAALGSVNLNRPLADYRDFSVPANQTLALSLATTTPASVAQAAADRQQFAKDIFARLVAALGAAATVDLTTGNVTIPGTVTPGTGQYDALRYLAQVAVNLVDYIDNDDVSTIFVWNPSNPADPPAGLANDMSATQIGNRVVFGVEKPRLLINEAYSELTNAPTDKVEDPNAMNIKQPLPAGAKAHARFWLELVNPTTKPHATNPGGIFGDGSVNLSAYRIEISRFNRVTAPAAQQGNLGQYLVNQANTDGRFAVPGSGLLPDAKFTFPQTALPNQPSAVAPNNGTYQPAAGLPASGFVLVGPPVVAKTGTPTAKEFVPPATGVWGNGNKVESTDPGDATTSTAMGYTFDMPAGSVLTTSEFKRHVVLLRRLANPHRPLNDPNEGTYDPLQPVNTYVTVDMLDYVPAFDSVHRANMGTDDRGERPNPLPKAGKMASEYFDPVLERFSVGKVQPLAGLSSALVADGAGVYNTYSFNTAVAPVVNSMVLPQTAPLTLPRPTPDPNEPKNTFGRHNGNAVTAPTTQTVTNSTSAAAIISDTIMTPFDWMPHMDRPLETLGDVFFARDCKPHLLGTEFVVNSTNRGLVYDAGYGNWRLHEDGLARALEFLTVKSPSYYVGHGGRVGGKVNVNVMQDRRIARGVWDPQASNKFDLNFVDGKVWDQWMANRTPIQTRLSADGVATNPNPYKVPVPNQRADGTAVPSLTDSSTGSDRPFLSFGAPAATSGPFAYGTTTGTGGTGVDDTILRREVNSPYPTFPRQPFLYQTMDATNPYTMNMYTQGEPFRKVVNNVTTVSHSFVVYVTIGYFEVTFPAAPANWPNNVAAPVQFGAEVYDKIPGDMRQKYIAFVDMSNMALKPNPSVNDADPHAQERPFFTALTETARPAAAATTPVPMSISYTSINNTDPANPILYVAADGQLMSIVGGVPGVGTQLVIGYGADQQVVTVRSIDSATGQLSVVGLTRPAWGGSCVSNVRPGYAGPQPGFDHNLPKYRPVVPYVERLR